MFRHHLSRLILVSAVLVLSGGCEGNAAKPTATQSAAAAGQDATKERDRQLKAEAEKIAVSREANRNDYVGLAEPLVAELRKTLAFIEVGLTHEEYRERMKVTLTAASAFQDATEKTPKPSRDHFLKCAKALSLALDAWQAYVDRLAENAKIGVREDLTTSAMRKDRRELWSAAAEEFRAGVVKMDGGS